jgi:hypothetical protein
MPIDLGNIWIQCSPQRNERDAQVLDPLLASLVPAAKRKSSSMDEVMDLICKTCAAWIQVGEHYLNYPYSRRRAHKADGVAIKEILPGVGRVVESHSPCRSG